MGIVVCARYWDHFVPRILVLCFFMPKRIRYEQAFNKRIAFGSILFPSIKDQRLINDNL